MFENVIVAPSTLFTFGLPVLEFSESTVISPTPVPVTTIPCFILLLAPVKVTVVESEVAPLVVPVVVLPFVICIKSPAEKSLVKLVPVPFTWFENSSTCTVPLAAARPSFDAPTSFK